MTMKSNRGPGSSTGGRGPLRQWSAPSYDPTDGRSVSSVDEQGSREHVFANNHARGNAQIRDAFKAADKRRTQNPTPVRKRPF